MKQLGCFVEEIINFFTVSSRYVPFLGYDDDGDIRSLSMLALLRDYGSLMKIPFGIWSLKKIHLGTEASDIEPVHDWLQARNVRANFDNENLCVSFGILGFWLYSWRFGIGWHCY